MGVAVVWWSSHRLGDREVRGSNLAAAIFSISVKLRLNTREEPHARSENGWMDVRECTRAQLDEDNTMRE